MKPLHIVILVAAGALGGAVIMKVALVPETGTAPVVAQVQAPPATAPAAPVVPAAVAVEPADGRATDEPDKPSPVEPVKAVRETPKPARVQRAAVHQARAEAVPASRPGAAPWSTPAEPMPAAPISAAHAEPAPAPAPAPAEAAPQPIPPAHLEAENATPPPPPAPPEPHRVTLNAGMLIPVRLVDGLTSERNLPGDSFTATLDRELVVDGFVIDWWDVISVALQPELQDVRLALRLAQKLKGCRTLVVSRTCLTAEALRLQLGIPLQVLHRGLRKRLCAAFCGVAAR